MGLFPDRSKKILLFGGMNSGKSELLKKIVDEQAAFSPQYQPTMGPGFAIKETDDFRYALYEMPGNVRFRPLLEPEFASMDVAIYCLDLSVKLNEEKLAEDIQVFKKRNNKAKLILVGTKSDIRFDLVKRDSSNRELVTTDEQLEGLLQNKVYGFVEKYVTSTLKNNGIRHLMTEMPTIINQPLIKPQQSTDTLYDEMDQALRWPGINSSTLHESLYNLKMGIAKLPKTTREQLGKESLTLITKLYENNNPVFRGEVIQQFEQNCNTILNNSYLKIQSIVLGVVVAAVVTVLAAAVGFGIGFLAGAWTGPGAFITAVLAGTAAATAVVTSSPLIGGGLGLFAAKKLYENTQEDIKEENALVKDVVEAAKNNIKP